MSWISRCLASLERPFQAIQINLAEISVGDLAQKNGGSDDVKSFGKMLVDDHTASNTRATSLAQSNGMTPPTGVQSCPSFSPSTTKLDFHRSFLRFARQSLENRFWNYGRP